MVITNVIDIPIMPSTRSQYNEDLGQAPTCHALTSTLEAKDGWSTIVMVHKSRFHIRIDPQDLGKHKETYLALRRAIDGCDPSEQTRDNASRKRKRSELEEENEYSDDDDSAQRSSDSGYETIDYANSDEQAAEPADEDAIEQATQELQNWALESFGPEFAKYAPAEDSTKQKTVYDWYHDEAYAYTIVYDSHGILVPEKEEITAETQNALADLVPTLPMPKYIQNYHIPVFASSDLDILGTSTVPDPIHATQVRSREKNEEYFLKLVDPTQPGPTKREIKIMIELDKKGISDRFLIPKVLGLVVDSDKEHPSSCSKIMGFLMSPIPDATPLTQMLDTDVAEEKRETWAKECDEMVTALHEAGIVWGDAKADNFLVDERGRLWMIDFGGSYTEGWVDSELAETEEGDEMGVQKIIGALEDPEAGTFDTEDEGQAEVERADVEDRPAKKQRKVDFAVPDQDEVHEDTEQDAIETYCYCQKPSSGTMIACDNEDCATEWCHIECTGLDEMPREEGECNDTFIVD